MRVDNHPPPMPVRSPWPRMTRQGWAASSMIHPRARMATFRKTPSPEVTISKMGSTSPTVYPSPSPCGQHTDSTMLPPLMPAPSSPSSSCGAIRGPWRHPDSEGGRPPVTDAGTLTTGANGMISNNKYKQSPSSTNNFWRQLFNILPSHCQMAVFAHRPEDRP